MSNSFPELNSGSRILLGPGPSNVSARVMKAMATPVIGHLDPAFVRLMDDIKKLLRLVFRTNNEITFPVSGTGSAGMEAAIANLVEPGDEIVVAVAGAFGARLADEGERMGARVHRVECEWGRIIEREQVEAALRAASSPRLVAIVHAETSTGIWQPVEEIAHLAHRAGALILLDAVTSLGCIPVEIDKWGIDACFSCTQKGLSAPPGLAPVTFGARAMERVRSRKRKCSSWYLDLSMIERYWSSDRVYHHTAPITMNYALYEALRAVMEEGLEARFERHRLNAAALHAGLEAMGLSLHAQPAHRLPQLATVSIPPGVNEAAVRQRLLADYSIEIAAGLGPLQGRVWRIGLLGESCRRENVTLLLGALEEILADMGFEMRRGEALKAVARTYATRV